MKPLCIYHANCCDGFGAAWVVRKYFGPDGVDFHPGSYGHPPPDVTGRAVILVDFSYKRAVLGEMASRAQSVLVLDHHKTAAADLADLPLPVGYGPVGPSRSDYGYVDVKAGYMPEAMAACAREHNCAPLYALFDMDRSGAGITWDFFFPDQRRPVLIDHIEDYDLWRKVMPHTEEIHAAIRSFPFDFDEWDRIEASGVGDLLLVGETLVRQRAKDVDEAVAVTRRQMRIGGHLVPVANLPHFMSSAAGNLMAVGQPFAASYWDTPTGRVFSLRSNDAGLDVSKIAEAYGGGGHRNAAGFKVEFDRLAEFDA